MAQLPKLLRKREQLSKKMQWMLLIAAVLVFFTFIFLSQRFFRWLSFEQYNQDEIYLQVLKGTGPEKTAAMAQWLRLLRENEGQLITKAQKDYLEESLSLKAGSDEDPFYRALLIGVLGYADELDEEACEGLTQEAAASLRSLDNPQWQQLFSESLATAAKGLPVDLKCSQSLIFDYLGYPNEFFASSAAHAAGAFLLRLETSDPFEGQLRQKLIDRIEVAPEQERYNVAFALARVREPAAKATLLELLRKAEEVGASDPDFGTYKYSLYTQAFAAAMKYDDETLRSIVRKISEVHPHLRLRQAAKIFVEKSTTPKL